MKLLAGKTLLITGGSSRLGTAFVEKAVASGATVLFTYHRGEAAAQALSAKGATGFRLDLADTAAIDAFAKELRASVERLDALIHNAACVRDHTLQNMTEADWDEVMAVDLKAPYYLTKKLLPLLMKKDRQHESKVFMLTSRAALKGGIGISNYAAAKAGLIGLAKSLALELGSRNVLVNAVNPGFMRSAMTAELPPEVVERNIAASPLGKMSEAEEVAGFLVYLCSDAMTQVTGQVFHFESREI